MITLTRPTLTPPNLVRAVLAGTAWGALCALFFTLALMLTHSYGDASTLNAGWTFGAGPNSIGWETRGDVGLFGQAWTPFGELNYADGAWELCPTGWTDQQCGA